MRGAPTALETWGEAAHSTSDRDSHRRNPERPQLCDLKCTGRKTTARRERKREILQISTRGDKKTSQCVTGTAFPACITTSVSSTLRGEAAPRVPLHVLTPWEMASPFQVTLRAIPHPCESVTVQRKQLFPACKPIKTVTPDFSFVARFEIKPFT